VLHWNRHSIFKEFGDINDQIIKHIGTTTFTFQSRDIIGSAISTAEFRCFWIFSWGYLGIFWAIYQQHFLYELKSCQREIDERQSSIPLFYNTINESLQDSRHRRGLNVTKHIATGVGLGQLPSKLFFVLQKFPCPPPQKK